MAMHVKNHLLGLRDDISTKRQEMIATAKVEGFTSVKTIRISQELDELINQYHRISNNKKTQTRSFQKYIKQTILFFYGSRYKLHNS
ncbi:aspartyl-phosphate phosphatase Spo0E family protein [Litchfieldia alkalitelluris]|uniref:aspartyl-phosphate phosphatase Spo0E family protein n=1 Tax=Litchfieldia alkalitelluris TaxID=304268 RepID=UPI0009985DAE|nr:aspartyl-phosphate phosphatase Spo0E family protein [Litchfieldia alkalitelluris]